MPPILAHRDFLRATVTNFFYFLSLNGFVLLPLHIQQIGGTGVEIGIVMGIYPAVGIICQPLIGPWVDVVGRRPFMLFGVVVIVLAALLATVAPSVPGLVAVRILQGLGFSTFFVASFSYVVDLVPPAERGWALGIYGVSGFVSTAFAPLLGEWVIRNFGFPHLFALSAVLAVVPGFFVLRMREVRPRGILSVRGVPSMRGSLDDVFRLHMIVSAFFGLGSGTTFAFLPTFAEDLGVRTLSLFYTAYAGAAIAVRVFGGRLIDTRGRRAVIVPSMFVQAMATSLLAVLGFLVTRASATPVLPVLFVAGLLSGAAHGFLYPGLAALVTDLTPEARRASAVGVFSAMFLTGQAGGAVVSGYVVHALGYGAMWTILTLLLLIGAALSARLRVGAAQYTGPR